MAQPYGATLEAWHHWATRLELHEHLLPVVANPGATISPDSTVKALGKSPTRYNFRREVCGFAKWTRHTTTMREVGQWEVEPDYGICVQTGERSGLLAIDVDVPHKGKSRAIIKAIERILPTAFAAKRYRDGTGKCLLLLRCPGPQPKVVIPVDGGVIELLGDGQQFVAESTYIRAGKADGRYLWEGGWPTSIDDISAEDREHLVAMLDIEFAVGEVKIARQRREGTGVDARERPGLDDPVAQYLLTDWAVRIDEPERLFIQCPFEAEHTSDSGPTETVYQIAGTGGFERGHFKCLHAHCMSRDDEDYLKAIGYREHDFPVLPEEDMTPDAPESREIAERPERPRYITDGKGRTEANTYNFVLFLSTPSECGRHIAWDDFAAQIIWAPESQPGAWRLWRDADYASMAMRMDNRGFKSLQPNSLRLAVLRTAEDHAIDLAVEWAKRLPEWDGVERIESFLPRYLLAEDTPYTRAVGRYLWTGHAGRLLDPGCQADMALLWHGRQGAFKSHALEAISPAGEMYVKLDMGHRDDDTARKLRGVLVAELEEMRGFSGREVESVKAFVTRKVENWVPKYGEFATKFKRRCLLHGTTNSDSLLNDTTGERRWLPFTVCHKHTDPDNPDPGCGPQHIDLEAIRQDRDQLWAEGIAKWREAGIDWREAERLAKFEHHKYKLDDVWEPVLRRWLLTVDPETGAAPVDRAYEWGVDDALVGAVGKRTAQLTRADQIRMGAALAAFGAQKKRMRGLGWVYYVSRQALGEA